MSYFIVICYLLALKNDLNALETASVVQIYKSERLTVTQVSHPAADCDLTSAKGFGVFINCFYKISFHIYPFLLR